MNRIISTVIVSIIGLTTLGQIKVESPTLVVGIMVDQLRSDYLDMLRNSFGERGIKRLMRDGIYFDNVDFGVPITDIASGTAIIYTGTYPYRNGISSATVYNTATKRDVPILNDSKYIGNYTNETYSPGAIVVSTLSDEIRMSSGGTGYVYSIAADPQQAIIQAGHSANCAFWINDVTGKWATSTYYKDVPAFMGNANYATPLSARIDTMAWVPMASFDKYAGPAIQLKKRTFKHTFSRNTTDKFIKFKRTPLANREVTNMAINYVKNINLGQRGELDMLNLAYTVAPLSDAPEYSISHEIQDSYLRLDRELTRLFDYIDKSVGLKNTVVFVASTGYFDSIGKDDEVFRIPGGEFSPKRAVSLLNVYLMAIYGSGEWVTGYSNECMYLNRALIKERGIEPAAIRRKSADFLIQMSGINRAYTLEDVTGGIHAGESERIRRSFYGKNEIDLIVEICPGWHITENNNPGQNKNFRDVSVATPMMIMAPGITPQVINTPVDATILAPSVSRLLRIRSPNASSSSPLAL